MLDRTLEGPAGRRRRARPTPAWSATSATSPSCSPRSGKADRGPGAPRPDRQGPDRQDGRRLLPADGGPAPGPHQHRPGRAGDRHDEGARAGGRRRQPRPALFQAGQAPRARARRLKQKGTAPPTRRCTVLQDVPHDPGRSKSGQTYESLEWAGESLLSLDACRGRGRPARVLDDFDQNPSPPAARPASERSSCTRLKLAAALRSQGPRTEEVRRGQVPGRGAALAVSRVPRAAWSRRACSSKPRPRPSAATGRPPSPLAGAGPEARADPAPAAGSYYDAWYHVAWALSQQKQTRRPARPQGVMRLTPTVGGPEMKAKYEALLARLSRSEAAVIGCRCDVTLHAPPRTASALDPRRAPRRGASSDSLGVPGRRRRGRRSIPGTTVKQAIGGRVRGQVQSESPTEVVVTLGANTTTVPTDQIVSIRYDGQPATFQLAETREAAGQLAEAAELYKKAAGEAAEQALRPAGRPVPRGRRARRPGPGRARADQGGQGRAAPVHPDLSGRPAHRAGPRGPGAAPDQ